MIAVATALVATIGGAVVVWRRNPRVGSAFVNSVVNPRLLQGGWPAARSPRSGPSNRRPDERGPSPDARPSGADPRGLPHHGALGSHSQWARNVMAAGHCRLQLHDVIYDLDEPAMIPAGEVHDLPSAVRGAMAAFGFEYLTLRTFSSSPGTFEQEDAAATVLDRPSPAEDFVRELATST